MSEERVIELAEIQRFLTVRQRVVEGLGALLTSLEDDPEVIANGALPGFHDGETLTIIHLLRLLGRRLDPGSPEHKDVFDRIYFEYHMLARDIIERESKMLARRGPVC